MIVRSLDLVSNNFLQVGSLLTLGHMVEVLRVELNLLGPASWDVRQVRHYTYDVN